MLQLKIKIEENVSMSALNSYSSVFYPIVQQEIKNKPELHSYVSSPLSEYEKDISYYPVTHKTYPLWGKIRTVDEIFSRGVFVIHGKTSIVVKTVSAPSSFGQATLRSFLYSVSNLVKEYEHNKAIVTDLDYEVTDILHDIELYDLEDSREKELKTNRLERRKAKNICELLEPIVEWCNETNSVEKLTEVIKSVEKVESYHNTREYTYKSQKYKENRPIQHMT